MEQQARDLGVHETSTVFGPLQTPDYVRAMRRAAKPDSTEDDLVRSVDLRRDRFERLSGKNAPKVHVVLSEAVFVQHVGGRDVMRDQVAHLIEVSRLPSVGLQVIPGSAGAYAAQGCPFVLLHLPWQPPLDVVFIESDMIASYLDAPAAVERYAEMFAQVRKLALNTRDTVSLLDRVRSNL